MGRTGELIMRHESGLSGVNSLILNIAKNHFGINQIYPMGRKGEQKWRVG